MNGVNTDHVTMKVEPSRAHADPISGEPGAHPIGVGMGAVGAGALAGAAGGLLAGPVGMMAGAAIGAVVGGLAGKAAAEAVNPSAKTPYGSEDHLLGPCPSHLAESVDYASAYRYGWESCRRQIDKQRSFDSMEAELERGWSWARGECQLEWDHARHAVRDAWNRVQQSDRAGRIDPEN